MNTIVDNVDEIFAWKDQYCVGVEIIDNAHMRLFTIVRRLLKNLMLNDYEKNRRTCVEVIKYLKQYTVEHFAQEEAYSEATVEHFAGVCAGWLTAHVMLEDQAMVGKVKSRWSTDMDTNAITMLQAKSEEFMNSIFQIDIEAENLNYDGYDIGKSIYYYTINKAEELPPL